MMRQQKLAHLAITIIGSITAHAKQLMTNAQHGISILELALLVSIITISVRGNAPLCQINVQLGAQILDYVLLAGVEAI
jgi:hypothetical protein